MEANFKDRIRSIAALADPLRLRIYRYVTAAGGEVSREQVAKALQIPRTSATFHLDRLAAEGLLDTTFRRLSERRGPGAGRTSKLYRRSRQSVEVSVPARDYEVAARALAQAAARTRGFAKRLAEAAREIGAEWAERRPRRSPLKNLESILDRRGYAPRWDRPDHLRLENCPFAALVDEHEDVICRGFNLPLIQSVVERLGVVGASAEYTPPPPLCCVSVRVR